MTTPRYYRAEEYLGGRVNGRELAGWVGCPRVERTPWGSAQVVEEMVPVLCGATCEVIRAVAA